MKLKIGEIYQKKYKEKNLHKEKFIFTLNVDVNVCTIDDIIKQI